MVAFTGLGSLPGTDYPAALRTTFDAVPDFAYLPEQPVRGPWAGIVGRGLGLPSGLPVDLSAGEWRLADAPGADQRRARATWRDDLDRLEEEGHDYTGRFKVAVAGPWTLAASVGVAHTGHVLADPGARRDLGQALAEGVGELLLDLSRRLPRASLVLQLDEPSLPAVAAGAVPTPGGFFRHRAVDLPEIVHALAGITAEPARRGLEVATVLHSCAPWRGGWPLRSLLAGGGSTAGFDGVSLDLDQVAGPDWDALAEAAESGRTIYLGCLPTTGSSRPLGVDEVRRRALSAVELIGAAGIAERLVLTPACGLAAWQPAEASTAFRVLARAADQVAAELA